jgi:hypothetical protein
VDEVQDVPRFLREAFIGGRGGKERPGEVEERLATLMAIKHIYDSGGGGGETGE